MTRAEAREFLVNLGVTEPTEAQITVYLNSVNANRQQPAPQPNPQNNDELERLRGIEQQYQLLLEQNNGVGDQIAELNQKLNRRAAVSILDKNGFTEADYKDFIDSLIGGTEEETVKRAEALAKAMTGRLEGQKSSLEKQFEEEKKKWTPDPNGVGGGQDDKPADVKNAEAINFGGLASNAQASRDFYK